jgi:cytochrome P450
MNWITPPMSAQRARELAHNFDLRHLPADFLANPYPVYDALRSSQPIRRMPDGSLFLTRHADLMAVYRDAKTFSSAKRAEFAPKYNLAPFSAEHAAPLFEHHTTSLVFNDPPAHSRVRQIIMGALSRRAIADMESGLHSLVKSLLDRLEQRGGGDLIEDFAAAIPVDVIGNLLGVPHEERGPLRHWSLAILGALEPQLTAQQHAQGNAAVAQFKTYLQDLIKRRRAAPGDPEHDVLTRLIQAKVDGEALDEQTLLHNCIFILNAGHETTTNLIGNALVALQEHPAAKAFLLSISEHQTQEMSWATAENPSESAIWDTAVDEILRFESSNQLGNRRAVERFELGGEHFDAGTLITLCIGAANRDPDAFDAPHELRLNREPNRHLAFGLGIHQCAGLSLARLEGRVAISQFLARFPNYRLMGDPAKAPVRGMRARFRGFASVQFSA